MKREMSIEYLNGGKDLNFEVDFRVNGKWYVCDQMGCYFIWIMVCFYS